MFSLLLFLSYLVLHSSCVFRIYGSENELGKNIHLTFDDGPNNKTLEVLLDVLDEYDIKATFFMVGVNLKQKNTPELIMRLLKSGHWLGAHSNAHPKMNTLDTEKIELEFEVEEKRMDKFLRGFRPHLFREPYGQTSNEVDRIMNDRGYVSVRWNIDGKDWRCDTPKCVISNIENSISTTGGILLLHEYNWTVASIKTVIETILDKGFDFLPIPAFFTPEIKDFLKTELECDTIVRGALNYPHCKQLEYTYNIEPSPNRYHHTNIVRVAGLTDKEKETVDEIVFELKGLKEKVEGITDKEKETVDVILLELKGIKEEVEEVEGGLLEIEDGLENQNQNQISLSKEFSKLSIDLEKGNKKITEIEEKATETKQILIVAFCVIQMTIVTVLIAIFLVFKNRKVANSPKRNEVIFNGIKVT